MHIPIHVIKMLLNINISAHG